ncbi:MAG: NADH-quinone oxidoreductase subunit N [Planctomycetes bacterium]|nr:NADH-quinone oxidoreductase subunit N [Planctomycetota bacterium]
MPDITNPFWIRPELCLTAFACAALLVDLLFRESVLVGAFSLMGLLATGYFLLQQYGQTPPPGHVLGCVAVDRFATLFKLFAVGSLIFVVLFTLLGKRTRREGFSEFYFILLCAGLGAFFLASTYHLLMMFLGLELLSISSYVLTGYYKGNRRSGEAALKYVIFGAVASGVMLYGFTLIYGLTGSLDLLEISEKQLLRAQFEAGPSGYVPISIAVAMCFAGFAYKISIAPFHFWTPDVYEGAPTPVTTFLAVASKGSGFAAMLRFLSAGFLVDPNLPGNEAMMGYGVKIGHLVALLAAVTMTLGNLAALQQTNLKRMLAYSSIAHAGYILMGVATMNDEGFKSVLFYLVAYYFMNLGAFGAVIYFANTTSGEEIDDLRGLGWRAPVVGVTFIIFLVALVGLPPTSGFVGKYNLFVAAIRNGYQWLAVVAGLNTAISLFYYFRIAKAMYLRDPDEGRFKTVTPSPMLAGLLVLLAFGTLWFGIGPGVAQLQDYAAVSQTLTTR